MSVEWIFNTKEYLSIFYSTEYSKKSTKIQETEEKHCDELPFFYITDIYTNILLSRTV